MLTKQYGKESFDLHLFILCGLKKIWILLFAGMIGGIVFGGVYYLNYIAFGPEQKYEMVSESYMEYAVDGTGEEYTIFNQTTWENMIYSDDIMNPLAKVLGFSKEELRETISATLLSDTRILTTKVAGYDKEVVERTNQVLLEALQEFGEDQREFVLIRPMLEPTEAVIQNQDIRLMNSIVLGIAIGMFLSFFLFVLFYIWDDRIYFPDLFEKRYDIPMLGNYKSEMCKKNAEKLLDKNIQYMIINVDQEVIVKNKNEVLFCGDFEVVNNPFMEPEVIEKLSFEQPIILFVSAKKHNSKLIEATLQLLEKHSCNVVAAVLTESNEYLQKMYYFPGSKWMKEHLK